MPSALPLIVTFSTITNMPSARCINDFIVKGEGEKGGLRE